MRIPKKFNYMGKQYRVIFEDLTNESKWGLTDYIQQLIVIEATLSPEAREQTFIHELFHVVIFELGIDKALRMSDVYEERLVNSMSNGFYALIKEII